MFDKKDPPQASVNAAHQEDDDIIDLTEEVVLKAEEDTGIIELTEDPDEDTPTADNKDKSLENDDVVIVDNMQDEMDEGLTGMTGGQTGDTKIDEDLFDLEEKVQLEYELDEDEDELIELDDERADDDQDFVDIFLSESTDSDRSDHRDALAEFSEHDPGEPDNVIALDADRESEPEMIAAADDEAPEFVDNDDLSDLETVTGFEFEEDDHEEDSIAMDVAEAGGIDDVITRTVEQSLGSDDDHQWFEPEEEIESESGNEDVIMALKDTLEDDEDMVTLADEEPSELDRDEGLLDLDDAADLEDDDVIISLEGFDNLAADQEDDIIEITEFDEHFPAADETLLKQTGMLDVSGAKEEDFLELIEVEEDKLSEDKEIKDSDDTAEKDEYPEVDRFFGGGFEEDELRGVATEPIFSKVFEDNQLQKENNASISSDILEGNEPEDEALEPIFGDASNDEDGAEEEIMEGAEEVLAANQESAAETETPFSEDEDFEFNFEPGAGFRQIDRLDTFLAEDSANEPDVASLHEGQTKEEAEESVPRELQAKPEPDELPALTPGQIDAAVERVISQKFSDRIEDIIYRIIEKAVAKEIDRLKRALLENDTIDDRR